MTKPVEADPAAELAHVLELFERRQTKASARLIALNHVLTEVVARLDVSSPGSATEILESTDFHLGKIDPPLEPEIGVAIREHTKLLIDDALRIAASLRR